MALALKESDKQEATVRRKKFPNKLNVQHDGAVYEIDVDAEVAIDKTDLMNSFLDQAGKFAWYAAVHAGALTLVDKCKLRRDIVKAKAMARLRKTKDRETGKYPSETQILNMIDGEEDVAEAQKAYHDAQEAEYKLKAVKEAFSHRRDMLTQIGADVRQEKRDRSF